MYNNRTNLNKNGLSYSPSRERDVLDAAPDDVSLGNGNDVSHTVTGVDDRARQGALGDLRTPSCSRKNRVPRRTK